MKRSACADRRTFRGRAAGALIGFLLALTGATALAAEAVPTPEEQEFAPAETDAPIVVWNRTLITLRVPFGHLAPAERAAAAEQRIGALLETMRPEDLASTWVHACTPERALIRPGTQVLFGVLPGDVDGTRAGAERAGERVVADLKALIEQRTESLRLPMLLKAIGVSMFAGLVFIALIAAVARVHRRLQHRIEQTSARRHAHGLDLRPLA